MKTINIMRLFIVGGLLPFALGITLKLNAAAGSQTKAQMGQEFAIKVGQQVKLDGVDLALKFVGVPQDSRCPSNVNCVWAGDAEVALESAQDKCTTVLKLHTHQGSTASNEAKASGVRIKLVKLDPYPHTERKISPGDYVATLIVTKD